jgi:hypothetical protein
LGRVWIGKVAGEEEIMEALFAMISWCQPLSSCFLVQGQEATGNVGMPVIFDGQYSFFLLLVTSIHFSFRLKHNMYTGLKYQGDTPFGYQYTLKKKTKGVKQIFSRTEYQWKGVDIRKG